MKSGSELGPILHLALLRGVAFQYIYTVLYSIWVILTAWRGVAVTGLE